MSAEPSKDAVFKLCSSCKRPIGFEQSYFLCNVSTCNRPRTGLFFCSISCWEAHVPMMRHRDAWAEPAQAPSKSAWLAQVSTESEPTNEDPVNTENSDSSDGEVLVVVSKLKKYIRDRSGMNTSDSVSRVLSNQLRQLCDQAIEEAKKAGRKTVMDRDFVSEPPASP